MDKRKAYGIDKVTKEDYERNLEGNLANLVRRMKSGSYRPNPTRRVYIPKETKGKMRPLGISCYEDKLVENAIAQILEQIYEPKFYNESFGFRPNRNCHQAVREIIEMVQYRKTNYVVEADIRGFFDNVDHGWLMKMLSHDIAGKYLDSERGTPQGNGASPVLANVYLHYVLGSIGSMVVTFVVALIFAIYLLAGREKLFAQFQTLAKTYLKETWYRRTALVLSTAHDTFSRFIVGQCTEAVILGALCTAGMFLFRFPYAAMVGTLIGATALLPVVGAYLGAFVGAFMIFTVSPLQAVGFLVFIAILQQIEGNLIYPRVVGSSVGLPGIWVLCAVTIGGGLSGIIGMLFAVPLTATVYKLIRQDVRKRQAKPAQERIGGK